MFEVGLRRIVGRCRAVSVFALLLAVIPSPTASGAASPSPRFFGINVSAFPTPKDGRVMARGGISEARVPVAWSDVEPSRHAGYNWAGIDTEIQALAAGGVRTVPFLYGVPRWVSHDRFEPPTSRARGLRRWKLFIAAAVDRYGANGAFWSDHAGLPYLPVRDWQLWNEPNFPVYWGGHRASAKQYLDLLRPSSRAVRSADPAAQVVLAGLGPGLARRTQVPCWKYLNRLYRAGAKRYFDVVSDHPYAAGAKGAAAQLRHVAAVMRRHHDHAPLWIGEVGWTSHYFRPNRLAVGPHRQATLLRRIFRFAIGHRRALHIRRLFWFDFRDPPDTSLPGCPGCFAFGLRHNNGRPKPSWDAFRGFAR